MLAVFMVFAIPLAAIIGGIFIVALKVLKGSSSGKEMSADETRLIQEIYNGLTRMEDRIEALETILLDRTEKGSAGPKSE